MLPFHLAAGLGAGAVAGAGRAIPRFRQLADERFERGVGKAELDASGAFRRRPASRARTSMMVSAGAAWTKRPLVSQPRMTGFNSLMLAQWPHHSSRKICTACSRRAFSISLNSCATFRARCRGRPIEPVHHGKASAGGISKIETPRSGSSLKRVRCEGLAQLSASVWQEMVCRPVNFSENSVRKCSESRDASALDKFFLVQAQFAQFAGRKQAGIAKIVGLGAVLSAATGSARPWRRIPPLPVGDRGQQLLHFRGTRRAAAGLGIRRRDS